MGYDITGASQAMAAQAQGEAYQQYTDTTHVFTADGSTASVEGIGNNLQLGDLSHGTSVQGAFNYLEGLQTEAFAQAKEAILNTENLFATLRNGWQGAAETTFEKNMTDACQIINEGLDEVYQAIYNLVNSLVTQYFDQDRQLTESIEEEVSGFRAGGGE